MFSLVFILKEYYIEKRKLIQSPLVTIIKVCYIFNMTKEKLSKYLMYIAVIFIMVSAFLVNSYKSKMKEAARLPFYNVKLENIEDGVYNGSAYTSFAHVQVKVTVSNHKLITIETIECEGSEVGKAINVLQEMVEQNKIVVPAKKGREIGTMVFISCVDNALHGKDVIISDNAD